MTCTVKKQSIISTNSRVLLQGNELKTSKKNVVVTQCSLSNNSQPNADIQERETMLSLADPCSLISSSHNERKMLRSTRNCS